MFLEFSKRDFVKERKDKEQIDFLIDVIESDMVFLLNIPILDYISIKLISLCKEQNNFTEIKKNLSKQIKLFESRLNGNKQAELLLERYSNLIEDDFIQFRWLNLKSYQFYMMVKCHE